MTAYLGIDVGKLSLELLLLRPEHPPETGQFENNVSPLHIAAPEVDNAVLRRLGMSPSNLRKPLETLFPPMTAYLQAKISGSKDPLEDNGGASLSHIGKTPNHYTR